jgi:hypothetical protein
MFDKGARAPLDGVGAGLAEISPVQIACDGGGVDMAT